MKTYFLPCEILLLTLGTHLALTSGSLRDLRSWVVSQLDDIIFDTLGLAEFPNSSLSRCLMICSLDARCVSVFYHKSRGQCRLQGGLFYLAQGGREEQGWRYYLMEMGPQCPVRSGYIHRRDLSLCYRPEFQVAFAHAEAASSCTKEGGHLLCIDSQEKQDHVAKQLNSFESTAVGFAMASTGRPGYFVDGKYVDGNWTWLSSGQQMTFSDWLLNQDMVFDASRVLVILNALKNWRWASVADFPRSYICEIDI